MAVKAAFVKALRSGGVDREGIARVREELGLASVAEGDAVDQALGERSLKPLTRQQVREILDRYAATWESRRSISGPTTTARSSRPSTGETSRTSSTRPGTSSRRPSASRSTSARPSSQISCKPTGRQLGDYLVAGKKMVARVGIGPTTHGFSVRCSTS